MSRSIRWMLPFVLLFGHGLIAEALCETYVLHEACMTYVDGNCVEYIYWYEQISTGECDAGGGGGGGWEEPEPDPLPVVEIVQVLERGHLVLHVEVTITQSAELVLYAGGSNYSGVPVVPGTEVVIIDGPTVAELATTTFMVQACTAFNSCGSDSVKMTRDERSLPGSGKIYVTSLKGDDIKKSEFGHRFAHTYSTFVWDMPLTSQYTKFFAKTQATVLKWYEQHPRPAYGVTHLQLGGWFSYITPSPCNEYVPGVDEPYDVHCSTISAASREPYEMISEINGLRVYFDSFETAQGDLSISLSPR